MQAEVKAGHLISKADNDTPLWEVLKPANKVRAGMNVIFMNMFLIIALVVQ